MNDDHPDNDTQRNAIEGDDNVIYSARPGTRIRGSRNTIVGATDDRGNTILNQGGLAVGYGARADDTSIAIGVGASAGSDLASVLHTLTRIQGASPEQIAAATNLIVAAEGTVATHEQVSKWWTTVRSMDSLNGAVELIKRATPLMEIFIAGLGG